jgi:hypothetical protein
MDQIGGLEDILKVDEIDVPMGEALGDDLSQCSGRVPMSAARIEKEKLQRTRSRVHYGNPMRPWRLNIPR